MENKKYNIDVDPINSQLFLALKKRFEAEAEEASATLTVYYERPAGIGEHPQILDEMAKQVEKIAAAQDKLCALETHRLEVYEPLKEQL